MKIKAADFSKPSSPHTVLFAMQSASFVCLCAVIFDCALLGSGRWLEIFGVTPRMILCVLSLLFALPTMFQNIKANLKNPVHIALALFMIWLAISAVRGVRNHNNMSVLLSDLKGFMYLLLVPVAINCVDNKKRFRQITNVVLTAALTQSLAIIGFFAACVISQSNVSLLSNYMSQYNVGFIGVISPSISRIFTKSSPYIIVACAICVIRQLENKKLSSKYILLAAVYLYAILLSFTRSLFASAGVTALLCIAAVVIVDFRAIKKLVCYLLLTFVAFITIETAGEVFLEANTLNFAISRTFGTKVITSPASTLLKKLRNQEEKEEEEKKEEVSAQNNYMKVTENSDNLRTRTMEGLLEIFHQTPIFGAGLGAVSPARPEADEYFYHDMLARTGILGLLLYLTPYGIVLLTLLRTKRKKLIENNYILIALSLFAFWVATAFNPWMNAAIGISWYAIILTIPSIIKEKGA